MLALIGGLPVVVHVSLEEPPVVIVEGEAVRVLHIAPLGDPVAYQVKGYQLALRREEAAQIRVALPE